MAGIDLPKYEHRFSEWTPEREAIASLYDLLAILVDEKRTSKLATFPRPVSAVSRVSDEVRVASYHAAIAFLFPEGYR